MSRYEHSCGPIFELTKHGKRQEIHRLQLRSNHAKRKTPFSVSKSYASI
ncbi:hypothetical protein [Streptococcus sp. LMAG:39]|nr:hypothetical protein [Streptococcus sp. LMAG:39]